MSNNDKLITLDQFKRDFNKIMIEEVSNDQCITNLYIYFCDQIKKTSNQKVINTAILRNYVGMIDREECTWAWAAEQLNKIKANGE